MKFSVLFNYVPLMYDKVASRLRRTCGDLSSGTASTVVREGVSRRERKNVSDLFRWECPEPAGRFSTLIEVQRSLNGLDPRTRQLITIAIRTATRNYGGVRLHAAMPKKSGATKEEVAGAVVMNLHLTGLVTVPGYLPAALAMLEEARRAKKR